MFEWLNGLVDQGIDLGQNGLILIVVIMVTTVLAKTKALVPTVGAIILGAIVLFGTSDTGLQFLETKIGEDAQIDP